MERIAAAVEREARGDGDGQPAILADADAQSADHAAPEQGAEQQAVELASIIDRRGQIRILEDQAGRVERAFDLTDDGRRQAVVGAVAAAIVGHGQASCAGCGAVCLMESFVSGVAAASAISAAAAASSSAHTTKLLR